MLISPEKLSKFWGIKPDGVLHIGAHQAEEMQMYSELGWGHMHWIEANPRLVEELVRKLDNRKNSIYECAAWDINGKNMPFNETSDSQSSSLLKLKLHEKYYPTITQKDSYQVEAKRMDSLFTSPPPFSFVNIDIQGAELQAIRGMGKLLCFMDAIYCEVNKEELYEGCFTVQEIDDYLKDFDFERIATRWVLGKGWGDALYVNKNRINVALGTKVVNYALMIPFYSRQIVSRILSIMRLLNFLKALRNKLNRWQRA
jgi:FkbM family methyltransferase